MALSLLQRDPADPMAEHVLVAMQGDRLTVGRGADNDLVLPDPDRHLSKQHCLLERRGDSYIVTDVSTNGTFLNYQTDRLGTAPTPLSHGDVITVGSFELVVEIKPASGAHDILPPLADPADTAADAAHYVPLADPSAFADSDDDFLDDLLGPPLPSTGNEPFATAPARPPINGASQHNHAPATEDHFVAPKAAIATIPEDWEITDIEPEPVAPRDPIPPVALPAASAPAPVERQPAPDPTNSPAPASAEQSAAIQAFFDGIGMAEIDIPPAELPEVMVRMGQTMRAMIAGMRDILMARAALKSEMRVERTMIQAEANNPLKFTVSTAQAIEAILRPAKSGYLEPVAAVDEALRDIKAHEIATMTGMEAALKDLLTRLCPEQLSARIGETSGFGSLLGNRKSRAWEAYERHYAEIARQTEDDFQATFGREFARAYENQIKKL